jgi:hypothetical protein
VNIKSTHLYSTCCHCSLFSIKIKKLRFQVLTAASMKMTVLWMMRRVVWQKFTDVYPKVTRTRRGLLIALMIEAASTSETSVSFYRTTRHIPEESHLEYSETSVNCMRPGGRMLRTRALHHGVRSHGSLRCAVETVQEMRCRHEHTRHPP